MQSNAIRINYIKVRINKTQENSKYTLCGDREETIYNIRKGKEQISTKRVYDQTRLGGERDPIETV